MAELRVTLKSLSGVTLTRDRGPGDTNHSLGYIPGSALRGALAARYLAAPNGIVDDLFRAIFIEEGVSFGNLYPVKVEDGEILGRAFPLPLSARTCKYWKGFRTQRPRHGERPWHGVQDFLCRAALYQLGASPEVLLSLDHCRRESCEQPLDRLEGFGYCRGSVYHHREATTRLLARVAIDRFRGTAAEGILYTLEVLDEDQHFEGRILSAQPTWLEAVRRLGNEVQSTTPAASGHCHARPLPPLRVGVAKTRGLGLVSCTIEDDDSDFPVFLERLRRVHEEIERLMRSYPVTKNTSGAFYFSLTLESDALVPDPFLRYQTSLDADSLATALGTVTRDELQLVAHYSGVREVQGWNAALGLPKSDALAIAQGSSFLFAYLGADVERLQRALQALEEEGIGLRRGEGFGRVTVCHPFHWEVHEHE